MFFLTFFRLEPLNDVVEAHLTDSFPEFVALLVGRVEELRVGVLGRDATTVVAQVENLEQMMQQDLNIGVDMCNLFCFVEYALSFSGTCLILHVLIQLCSEREYSKCQNELMFNAWLNENVA